MSYPSSPKATPAKNVNVPGPGGEATVPTLPRELRDEARRQQGNWPASQLIANTPLVRLPVPDWLKRTGVDELYVKLEGKLVTSTIKARPGRAHVMQAIKLGYEEIVAASCGDYAEALAWFASEHGIRCTLFIPRDNETTPAVLRHIKEHCNPDLIHIELVPGNSYGTCFRRSEKYIAGSIELKNDLRHGSQLRNFTLYDANAGSANNVDPHSGKNPFKAPPGDQSVSYNRDIEYSSYFPICIETVADLKHRLYRNGVEIGKFMVATPAGNLTNGVAQHLGYKRIGHNPPLFGCTTNNPALPAWRKGIRDCPALVGPVCVTRNTEAVAGDIALDGAAGMQAIRDSGGDILEFSEKNLIQVLKWMEETLWVEYCQPRHLPRIRLLPVSGAGLAGIKQNPDKITRICEKHAEAELKSILVVMATGEID